MSFVTTQPGRIAILVSMVMLARGVDHISIALFRANRPYPG
jgi:hypothetical protein